MEFTQNGMSLKMYCHSQWNVTQNEMSLKKNVTQHRMSLIKCHSNRMSLKM